MFRALNPRWIKVITGLYYKKIKAVWLIGITCVLYRDLSIAFRDSQCTVRMYCMYLQMQRYSNLFFFKGIKTYERKSEKPIYCIPYLLCWDTKASLVFGLMWSLCWWIPLALTDWLWGIFVSGVAGFALCFGSPQADVYPDCWIFQIICYHCHRNMANVSLLSPVFSLDLKCPWLWSTQFM